VTQSGGEEKELAARCREIWFDLVELRQLWQTEGWKPRMHMSSERAKPLLLNMVDATPGPQEPPRAFIKMANTLVLADSLSHVHCHFGGNEITPAGAVELLRRASVNESAGMVSIYPADLPGPKFGLMIGLIGLRLQLPSKTAISVSSDKALRPDLTAVLPLVNKYCQEFGLSSLTQTELPAAILSQRISPPRTAPGRGTRLAMPGDTDSNNPLGWPANYPGEHGRGRHRP
jgi:hypothetical protein